MTQTPCLGPIKEEDAQPQSINTLFPPTHKVTKPSGPGTAILFPNPGTEIDPEVPNDAMDENNTQENPTCVVPRHKVEDVERLRPYFAFLPSRVIQETLKRTTRLAKAAINFPLIRHIASRFAWMN